MPRGKSTKGRKKKQNEESAISNAIAHLLSEDSAAIRRGALVAVIVAVVGAAGVLGLRRLEGHVHALNRFEQVQLWVYWEDCPDFLQSNANAHILRALEHEIALTASDTVLDEGLAHRVAESLSRPSIGWVKQVKRVIVRPDGRISILCDFREPAAYVAMGRTCYLVDSEGVRLPGEYAVEDCESSRLLMIRGVAETQPDVGQPWIGDDLSSGLRLVSMLYQQPFRDQVASINVENFGGRVSPRQPHLVMATNRPGSRIWWGRPPNDENGIENTARQKLALLQQLYSEYGRIDINQPFIDVRTYPNSVSIPHSSQGT